MEVIPGYLDIPLWTALLLVAAGLVYIYGTWTFKTWSGQGIKGPTPLPYVGTIIYGILKGGFVQRDPDYRKEYGRTFGEYFGRTPTLVSCDPEFLRTAMVKEFNSMPNRRSTDLGGLLNSFLTTLKDDHWRHVRSSLTPTFTSGKLKQMKGLIESCADRLTEHLTETEGQPFDSKQYAGGFTMDVISSTAFGIQVDSQKNPDDPILVNASEVMGTRRRFGVKQRLSFMLRIMFFVFCPGFLARWMMRLGVAPFNQTAISYFEELTGQILSERAGKKSDSGTHKDFIQLCSEKLIPNPPPGAVNSAVDSYGNVWSSNGLTKDEIIANGILFFLAGFETTASTLNYVMYELAMNPDVQLRCYEEITSHSSSEHASYEELSKMEYLDWVIDEALRLYPPAARVDRVVSEDTVIDGIHLPAGCLVSAAIYVIHHDPEIWPDPLKFDPERYSAENKEGRHSCAWIPFGIGNRNCIGMRLALLEIKIALVKLLTKFHLKTCAATPQKPLEYAKNFRMDPIKPIQLVCERRTTA